MKINNYYSNKLENVYIFKRPVDEGFRGQLTFEN